MHKNIPAAELYIAETVGSILKCAAVSEEHLPLGVHFRNGVIDRREFNGWRIDRLIPLFRPKLNSALFSLGVNRREILPLHSYWLSLSDHYWIKPMDSDLKWEDVNFFDNAFTGDVGDALFGKFNGNSPDLCSPDNTTDGCLQKRWIISDGKRFLMKGGEPPYYQQPFNEVTASRIMDIMDIPHIRYSLVWEDGLPYSLCETFTDSENEYVPAWRIINYRKKPNHKSFYRHYADICKEYGIDDIEHYLDMLIVLDYVIANEDRHFNNFGLLRNSETMGSFSPAPIFDSGTSLAFSKSLEYLYAPFMTKPFKTDPNEQLKLVTSFDWINFSALESAGDAVREVMSGENAEKLLGKTRSKDISSFVMRRIDRLRQAAEKH